MTLRTPSKKIESFKARANRKRTTSDKLADILTDKFGSMPFLLLNTLWFAAWIIINLDIIPGVTPFDPYPFGLLTMVVSLEAIILAIVVLISQNRQSIIAEMREEIDLQMDIITESEITKSLHLLKLLADKQKIQLDDDKELIRMLKETNFNLLEDQMEKEVEANSN